MVRFQLHGFQVSGLGVVSTQSGSQLVSPFLERKANHQGQALQPLLGVGYGKSSSGASKNSTLSKRLQAELSHPPEAHDHAEDPL